MRLPTSEDRLDHFWVIQFVFRCLERILIPLLANPGFLQVSLLNLSHRRGLIKGYVILAKGEKAEDPAQDPRPLPVGVSSSRIASRAAAPYAVQKALLSQQTCNLPTNLNYGLAEGLESPVGVPASVGCASGAGSVG